MDKFQTILYEAVLVAFGKVLAKYDLFAEGEVMRDIGKEILEYLNSHGFSFSEQGNLDDLTNLTKMFVENGFAESLEVKPSENGNNYIWKNLFGLPAYKELNDIALNPFLSCPLNLCLYYVAGKQNKRIVLHKKEFDINSGMTEAEYEIVDDDSSQTNLDDLVLIFAKHYDIAHERELEYHQQAMTDPLMGL